MSYRKSLANVLILVSTPNYASLWPVVEGLVNRFGEISYEHQHITRFNRSSLDSFMQQDSARFRFKRSWDLWKK
jgi:hypothetical protein